MFKHTILCIMSCMIDTLSSFLSIKLESKFIFRLYFIRFINILFIYLTILKYMYYYIIHMITNI